MKNTSASKPLFLGAFVVLVFLITAQKGETPAPKEFVIDEPAPRTVFSPIRMVFVDEAETARRRQEKESQVLPVYAFDPKVKNLVSSRVERAMKELAKTQKEGEEGGIERLSKALAAAFERLFKEGVLEDARKKELLDSGKSRIQGFDPETKALEEKEVKGLLSVSEAKEKVAVMLEKEGVKERAEREKGLEIFTKVIQPNLFFDEDETKERVKQVLASVAPVTEEVKRGEMVIQKGLWVTQKQQERLTQIQKKMAQKRVQTRLVTVSLVVFLGLALVFFYLRQFESKESNSPRFLALILAALLATLAAEKITVLIPGSSLYLLPGALAGILLTILWSPRLGLLGPLSMPLLSAPLAEFRLEIILMVLVGSLTGCFAARGIRKRVHFLKVGLAVGLVNAAVLIAYFLSQDWPLSEALEGSTLGVTNGFLVTTLAFFLVPLAESLFNLTTDISLLELSDLNHPLLKRMVVEAPGTYHHSLVVSTLAEAACEVIGANALLARVGSYFHDIGKIARSEYFTENQTRETRSRHEKLTPTMSCLIIMSHVKEGVELAKKYKLKDVIVRFIPEHQGKGVIYYFYKKALDQAAPGETVRADDFRYPGPKPQSRETAVALLADSVEAASRSLKEITPPAIRTLVRKVINEKFIDGQLDECDLTLKDLHKIQESLVQNLMAIFHTRVDYPPPPKDPYRADLFQADQFTKFR